MIPLEPYDLERLINKSGRIRTAFNFTINSIEMLQKGAEHYYVLSCIIKKTLKLATHLEIDLIYSARYSYLSNELHINDEITLSLINNFTKESYRLEGTKDFLMQDNKINFVIIKNYDLNKSEIAAEIDTLQSCCKELDNLMR